MKSKEQGSAIHIVVIIVLIVAIVGVLGFIFWQNFVYQPTSVDKTSSPNTTSIEEASESDGMPQSLNLQELGIVIDLADAPFDDIAYAMTSVNTDDTNKYVAAVYSKKALDARVVEREQSDSGLDYSDPYWKYSTNNAVYVYWYNPDKVIIDGVGDIIDPANKNSSSKVYVGFMGPMPPSSDTLLLRDWLQNKIGNQ